MCANSCLFEHWKVVQNSREQGREYQPIKDLRNIWQATVDLEQTFSSTSIDPTWTTLHNVLCANQSVVPQTELRSLAALIL